MRVVTVARKPLSEPTVAENLLRHGTGALNLKAAKVLNADGKGRVPANIILVHKPSCKIVGIRKVRVGVAVRRNSGGKNIFSNVEKPPMADMTYAGPDGFENVHDWECEESCPVRCLNEQAGRHVSHFFTQVSSQVHNPEDSSHTE
ncbi:unnamed protein product [marine sediment metagenome]|uniref:Uncharacterized protein n=1 Tax=marine sediment metagenome TaxID=412755 RepID=X0YCI0_9ZZZZ